MVFIELNVHMRARWHMDINSKLATLTADFIFGFLLVD